MIRDRIARRLATGYLDEATTDLDEALDRIDNWRRTGTARSIGVAGNAADIVPEILRSGVVPDILTDQTSAHDALNGYVPHGMSLAEAIRLRERQPERYVERSMASIACHVEAMLALRARGAVTFDYGNNIRAQAKRAGVENAFDIPGFVPEYVRPLFCEGKGPFRWVALSGDPDDILATDQAALDMFFDDEALCRWIQMARARVKFQGLPARICWLGYGDRARFGHRINEMVRTGVVKAPIVIGRDHLDAGSVASPYRETEGMLDGSDAIADWPVLNALLNASAGATWVSVHHGGGTGIGYSLHAGMVMVADGDEGGRREDRARADVRSRHRGCATCGRGISRGARDGEVAWHQTSHARPFDGSARFRIVVRRPKEENFRRARGSVSGRTTE